MYQFETHEEEVCAQGMLTGFSPLLLARPDCKLCSAFPLIVGIVESRRGEGIAQDGEKRAWK